jgi:hypothetical protein
MQRLAMLPEGINGYTDRALTCKLSMHTSGRAFLKRLAADLQLPLSSFEIRSNKAGPAVSGEVTLHSESLYVQVLESCVGKGGVSILYRSCAGRKDYCGGANHWTSMRKVAEGYPQFVDECRQLSTPIL